MSQADLLARPIPSLVADLPPAPHPSVPAPVGARRENGAARVGYVVKVYPRFSETFVVTEILAREAAGEEVAIFALRPTTDTRFHPEIARVQAPVHHLPKPTKLSEAWLDLRIARSELPDFDRRYADLLSLLTTLDAEDAAQGVALAIQAHRAGITHLHAHFASLAARVAAVAAGLLGIGYSVTTHAKDLFHQDVDAELLGRVLSGAEHVVAISEFNRQHLLNRCADLADAITLIRNGVELSRFDWSAPGPIGQPLRIAAVGRLVEKKGFNRLIESVRRLAADGFGTEVRIAGSGELHADLAEQIDAGGTGAFVQLLGPRSQSEVIELLAWADVLVAPCVVGRDGNADGLPTVLLEAMALGVPVISTDVTGIGEAVRNDAGERTGILIRPSDVNALSEALRTVADPDFDRVSMCRAARALVEREYSSTTQSSRL
ncbi:MAG: glycosyltransferase, partial [Propionibacteriales bacterium]|nr:glycosyltransferase [Propionibacteriales bacterium]